MVAEEHAARASHARFNPRLGNKGDGKFDCVGYTRPTTCNLGGRGNGCSNRGSEASGVDLAAEGLNLGIDVLEKNGR